ncbi:MAG: hypothetical protein ACJ749_05265 [Flavisolibacter sp.]
MRKYILVATLGVLTTAAVTATMLGANHKKTTTKNTNKKECVHSHCPRASATACY